MNKLFNWILKYPRVILVVTLVSSAALFFVMKNNSRMETDLDKYMPQQHPAFVYSDQAEEWFNINDGIIIAIEHENGIYNSGTLQKVKDLTKALQQMDEINKKDVTSLYTADNIIGTDEGMDVKAFYKRVPQSDGNLKTLRQNVRNNDMISGRLVSESETVTVIIAEIEDDVFTQEFYKNILETAKTYEGPENVYVAGRPIVEGTMALLGPADMKRMVPIVLTVIVLVLLWVMRSFKNTIFTMLVVLFSVVWAFGLMALINIPIYAVSTMIPVMLIAIGVADGIHLYSHLDLFMLKNPNTGKMEAVKDMLAGMWKPVAMTSVTTAVGFISLLTSQVYPIKYFGIFTAIGVMMAMVFSLLLIPAAILVFGLPKRKPKVGKSEKKSGHIAYRFAEAVVKNKVVTYISIVFIVVLSIYGMSKVWINSSFLEKFETDSDIVLTDKFINQNFGGTSTINVILESQDENVFKQPHVMQLIDEMQAESEKLTLVGNSFSLADYLRRMNKVMHADSVEYDTIPESNKLIAQYLLLYEMSGDPENLWKVVDYKYNKANITLQLKSDNSKAINAAIAVVDQFVDRFQKFGVSVKYAGSGYKGLVFTDLILQGQITSLLLSLIIIVVLLSIMFRKISIGFIGAVPIAVTAFISFGIMGLFDIPLSTTTALISSIAIGIGIDYAVHFIERYKINALETQDRTKTIQETMHHSGRAIIFNALVVIAGFLVLLASVFPPNRSLGALVSLNMFTSFLGTITIMFILIYASNIYFKNKS
ncbi:MAG: MMPL family transporter [Deferribacteres bacterium]|nr:MMPL family transporter [candidate division KSB1 bacterium]MCB9503193.1 MMPL family transporter [Deferribacteres bacterium]